MPSVSLHLCLCLCVCLPLLALPAAAAESYGLAGRWSYDVSDKGYLERPGGITGDASGQVYVVDRESGEVQFYSPSGAYLGRWGALGTGELLFTDPADVSLDADGHLYVADTGNGRVQTFTQGCNVIATWGGNRYSRPVDVVVAKKGKAYVADVEQPEVLVVDEEGRIDGTVGFGGEGDGGLSRPRALALDSGGNLLVLDEALARVTKYDRSGAFVLRFGEKGAGDGQFDRPEGLAVDTMDNVYVADSGNGRIVKFDPSGALLAVIGSRGSGDGQFLEGPFGVWVDPQGTVYVPDLSAHGVQLFRLDAAASVSAPGANATQPDDGNATAPANGTAAIQTCDGGLCDVNGTPSNRTANGTPALASLTPLETVTASNITTYGTPTPPRSLPAPVGGLVGALAALAILARRGRS
jgi:sugar lactone lactonase YvrE